MQLGKTRWRRFAVPMALSTAAIVGMGTMVTSGVLAASFGVSGQEFKVSADQLRGTGFQQFPTLDQEYPSGTLHPIALSAIKSAQLDNLCQSVVIPTGTPLGNAVLRISTNGTSTASNLTVDTDDLAGSKATFTNIDIGKAAGLTSKGGATAPSAAAGLFAQEADGVTIDNLKQQAWATSAGTFVLNGLHLQVALASSNSLGQCF